MARNKTNTNDQNAPEDEQDEAPAVEAAPDPDHIEMRKSGHKNIHVHPAAVEDHKRIGWKEA